MTAICPDCGKKFIVDVYSLHVYQAALKTNPNLKFVCSPCGIKIELCWMLTQNQITK